MAKEKKIKALKKKVKELKAEVKRLKISARTQARKGAPAPKAAAPSLAAGEKVPAMAKDPKQQPAVRALATR